MENLEEIADNHRPVIINKVANGISKFFEKLRIADELPTLSNGRPLIIRRPLKQPELYSVIRKRAHERRDSLNRYNKT